MYQFAKFSPTLSKKGSTGKTRFAVRPVRESLQDSAKLHRGYATEDTMYLPRDEMGPMIGTRGQVIGPLSEACGFKQINVRPLYSK